MRLLDGLSTGLRIVGRYEAARDTYRTARSDPSALRRAWAPVAMAGYWL